MIGSGGAGQAALRGTDPKARALRVVSIVFLSLGVTSGSARAQPGRINVGVGVRWTGEMPAGTVDATETAPSSARYRLFATETVLTPSSRLDTTFGVRLTRALEAEIAASYASSDLRTRVGSDAEGIPDSEAVEAVNQLSVEASVLVHFARWAIAGRATPFATIGGGYLRHLHENRTLAETGSVYHAGAGVTLMLSSDGRGWLKATGLRVDARAVARIGGVAFDDDPHVAPAVGASFFARF